jgi:hypothetical protein
MGEKDACHIRESIVAENNYVRVIHVLENFKTCYSSMDVFSISCCLWLIIVNKLMLGNAIIKQITYINTGNAWCNSFWLKIFYTPRVNP